MLQAPQRPSIHQRDLRSRLTVPLSTSPIMVATRSAGSSVIATAVVTTLAGSGSVWRRERPGPASLDCSRLAPLLAGPRRAAAARAAPATTSAPPRSAPRARALNANDYVLRKTNTFHASAGSPARLVGRAPSSTIRTHLAPAAQPPVALAGAVALPFPASFWPISSRIGFLTEIRGTEPQWMFGDALSGVRFASAQGQVPGGATK